MDDDVTMERKALSRLVDALLDDKYANNRHEAVEKALVAALIALEGQDYVSQDDKVTLLDNMESLAVQIIVQAREDGDVSIYKVKQDNDRTVHVVATDDPIIISMIDRGVQFAVESKDDTSIQ